MEQIKIKRDQLPTLRFRGELIASASTQENCGVWTELRLYRTSGNNFVASRIDRTIWEGANDSHQAKLCKKESEIISFFGQGELAKEIYDSALINNYEDID